MPDSTLIAAVVLLIASLYAALCGAGVYLRFAAILTLAIAVAVLANGMAPGVEGAVALAALPLAGASLALCAIARAGRPLPALPATLALVFALLGGLAALAGAGLIFALLPPLLAGLVAAVAGLHRAALRPLLAGLLLAAAACAFFSAGVGLAGLLLLAAALAGFAVQTRASKTGARLLSVSP
jgi:hypothetical protein